MGLYLGPKFWGKGKFQIVVLGFFFGVYNICSLYVATHLPLFQSLDPCLLKILDARQG